MSFLSALYLIGTAAVAAPIFIHMIRRAPRDNFKFSTLRFLSSSPETVSKRSKIQHWLLLLLRALAIVLIALAFARPYFVSKDQAGEKEKKAVVMFLVDQSASMNREGVKEKLLEKLNERLERLKENDLFSLRAFGADSHAVFDFSNWLEIPLGERKAQLKKKFSSIEDGWAESKLSVSFIESADALDRHLDEYGGDGADLEIFTDGQAGGGLDELRSFSWPKRINLVVHNIEAGRENASISLVDINSENRQVKIKVENPPESKELSLWLELKNGEIIVDKEPIVLKPGQLRFHVFDLKKLPEGMERFTVQLSGDSENYDNKLYCIIPKVNKKEIVWLGKFDESAKSDDFYFKVLCDSREDLEVTFESANLHRENFSPSMIAVARDLSQEEINSIQKYMDNGGTVLFLLKDEKLRLSLEGLSQEKIHISEVKAPDYFLLSEQRFDHWLFQPFVESKFKDFSTIYFWKARKVTLEENTGFVSLAKLDEDIPAVLSKVMGKGELIVMASGWGKDDSQLALNSKFIPLVNSLVTASTRHKQNLLHYSSGDPMIGKLTGNNNSRRGLAPGFYDFKDGGETRQLAVNLSPAESKMKALENVDYEKAGIPFIKQSVLAAHEKSRYESEIAADSSEVKNQGIWRYLLISAILILLAESLLAHKTHKRMEQAV